MASTRPSQLVPSVGTSSGWKPVSSETFLKTWALEVDPGTNEMSVFCVYRERDSGLLATLAVNRGLSSCKTGAHFALQALCPVGGRVRLQPPSRNALLENKKKRKESINNTEDSSSDKIIDLEGDDS